MNTTYTFHELQTHFFHSKPDYEMINDPDCLIDSIKFYSPLEKELSEHTLYVTSLDSWHERHVSDIKPNIILFGEYHNEFHWCKNIVVFEDTPEKRKSVEEIQRIFFPEAVRLQQISDLTHAMIQNNGLKYLVNQASAILNNPLIVFHGNMRNCTKALNSFTTTWREEGCHATEISERKGILLSCINEYLQRLNELSEQTGRYYDKFVYCQEIQCNIMIHTIQINNFDMATLVIIEKDSNQLDMDIHVIQVFIGLLAQELQKATYYMDNQGDTKASFLINLLSDLHPSEKYIQRALRILSYEIREKKYIIIVRFSRQYDLDIALLLYRFQSLLTGELYTIYQNQLVILCHRDKNQEIGDFLLKNMSELALRYHLLIGISQEFFELTEIRRYYHQAEKALRYGESLDRKNTKHPLYYFHDYTLVEMLSICGKNETLLDFCNEKILQLMRYDQKMHTNYFPTLYEYVENCFNVRRTAEALFIHKNTLIYRIDKIKKIINYDFTDSWENFTLYLSFRILFFTGTYDPKRLKEQ